MRSFWSLVFVIILLSAACESPLKAQRYAGQIDGIMGSTGSQYIQGWACEVGKSNPVTINTFTGGAPGASSSAQFYMGSTANQSGGDNVAACNSGSAPHMFRIPVEGDMYARTGQPIYIVVATGSTPYNMDGAAYYTLTNSGSYTVPGTTTVGYIDSLDSSGNLTGWACDTSNPTRDVNVEIFQGGGSAPIFGNGLRGAENGTLLKTIQTSVSRPDAKRCPTGNHGFSTQASLESGLTPYISVYAVPANTGAAPGALLPPSSSNASNVFGGHTVAMNSKFTTSSLPTRHAWPQIVYGYNLSPTTVNLAALSGAVTLTNYANYFSELLFMVGYLPSGDGPCPTSGTGTAPSGTQWRWSDMVKGPTGTATGTNFITPVNFTLPVAIPASNCLLVLINGGPVSTAHQVTGTVNLVATYTQTPDLSTTHLRLDREFCFGQNHGCDLNTTNDTQSFASVNQIDTKNCPNGCTLNAIWGNIGDSTFDGTSKSGPLPTGPWTANNDIYIYHGSACTQFPSGYSSNGPGNYYQNIPPPGSGSGESTHLVGAPLYGVAGAASGETLNYLLQGWTNGTDVYYDFTDGQAQNERESSRRRKREPVKRLVRKDTGQNITLKPGDCLVELYGVTTYNQENAGFDNEDQLHAVVTPQ